MTPLRSTRRSWDWENEEPTINQPQTPTRPSRTCRKRKLNYSEVSDDEDSNTDSDQSLKKRNKGVGSESSNADDDSPSSSLYSSPSLTIPSSHHFAMYQNDSLLVEADGKLAKIFRGLPVEIHQHIIRFLKTDRDVLRYGQICKQTYEAVDISVWRERCENIFDVAPRDEIIKVQGGEAIMIPWSVWAAQLYKTRQMETNCWVTFNGKNGGSMMEYSSREMQYVHQDNFLGHLKDMIFESNAEKITNGRRTKIVGKNLDYIREMTSDSQGLKYIDVLDCLLESDFTICPRGDGRSEKVKTATLTMVQLCLSPIILHPHCCATPVFHFDASQKLVYGSAKVSLFKGKYKSVINIELLLNTLNFFKFHLKAGNGEGLLSDAYARLDEDQLPQMWAGEIPMGTQPLTGHWKGATTFLDPRELRILRNKYAAEDIFSDLVDDENNLLDITFFHDEERFDTKSWPVAWDTVIGTDAYAELDNPDRTPKKKKSDKPIKRPEVKAFWGTSRGLSNGHMFGRVHSVNNQGDFHGWQRVTMLKALTTDTGGYNPEQVWVYEGVVLPGGRMIIGRWCHPFGDPENPDATDSGPFIFWNVDRSTASPPIDPEEAWEFAKQIDDPLVRAIKPLSMSETISGQYSI